MIHIENSPLQNILVNGGAGLIGSNFIPYFLHHYPGNRLHAINAGKLKTKLGW